MSTNQVSSNTGNSSLALSEERFHGILDIPKRRLIRRTTFDFISYIYSQYKPPAYYLMIFSSWRAIQYLIPGFFAGSKILYPEGDLLRVIISFFSIFGRIVPTTVDEEFFIPFTGAYILILFLFIIIVCCCTSYLEKLGKLHYGWCKFLVLFFEGPWVVIQPIIFSETGSQLGLIFIEKGRTNDIGVWGMFIIVILIHLFFTVFHNTYIAVALTFRPTSCSTYHFNTQFMIIQNCCVICFVGSIAPYVTSKTGRIVLMVFVLLLTASSYLWSFGYFQIIQNGLYCLMMSTVTLSIFGCIVSIICEILKKSIPAIFLFADVMIFIVAFIGFMMYRKRRQIHVQVQLDDIDVTQENFNDLKLTPFHALSLGIAGFSQGHQFVLNWDYFRLITTRWPEYVPTWIVWARFCSAFPEETGTLLWIDNKIRKLKLHKDYIAHLRAQIIFLARQREDSMTHVLKRKINDSMHEIQHAKNRLRHFWECVIQGNIVDMEAAAVSAQVSVQNADYEMLHLLHAYPNNQYVARVYSRFLLNVKGDKLEFTKWHQNCDQLKGGQKIVPDQAQQETLQLFPSILSLTVQKQNLTITTGLFGESTTSVPSISSSSCHIEETDEDHSLLLSSVRDSIQKMKIPAILCTRIGLIIFIVVFCVIWLPGIYIAYFVSSQDSFDIISLSCQAAFLRNSLSLMMLESFFLFSKLVNIFPNPAYFSDLINVNESLPYLGNTYNTSETITFLSTQASKYLDTLRSISNYDLESNKHLNEAHRAIFESVLQVTTINVVDPVLGTYVNQTETKSAESAILSFLLSSKTVVSASTQADVVRILSSNTLPNMKRNLIAAQEGLSSFSKSMTEYTQNLITDFNKIANIVSYVGYTLNTFLVFFLCIYVFIEIRKQKRIIIRAFMTIPKHIISKIVDVLKINSGQEIEADTSNDEIGEVQRNKQEENFLALLGTTSSTSSILFSAVTFIVVSIFMAGLGIDLNVYNANTQIQKSANIIIYAAPDSNYFLGSLTEFINALSENYRLAMFDAGFKLISDAYRENIIFAGQEYLRYGKEFYNYVLYGNDTLGLHQLIDLDPHFVEELCLKGNPDEIGSELSMHATYSKLSPDSLMTFFSVYLPREFVIGSIQPIVLSPNSVYLTEIITTHLYNDFYANSTEWIPKIALDEFSSKFTYSLLYTFLIYIVIFFFVGLAFFMLSKVNTNLKWMTEALLQCPPEALMASKQIVRLLTGQFKEKKLLLKTDQGNQYYDVLVDKFIDSVIFVKHDLTIVSANPATTRVIGVPNDTIIDKNFREILTRPSETDDGNIEKFFGQLDEALNGRQLLKFSLNVESMKPDGSSVYLNICVSAIYKRGVQSLSADKNSCANIKSIIIVSRDISQSVLSKKLLKEERQRSDGLLRHILPPVIVEGLQRGEKEISFAVVSATIVFMDIVEFTPWCASNTANMVMSTLNRLFKEFDWILSLHPTLTKMKCIGDCYVAAGGIFDDPNIPETHAKEMVHFGCLATKAVNKVNAEIGQTLRIRVGINTGGPIAAGVLGVDRPTFEIFGPTINMAQQMEHHGVPMMVHVSRSVYELIYSGEFMIRERGETEVKNGKVMTYLVDPEPVEYPQQ